MLSRAAQICLDRLLGVAAREDQGAPPVPQVTFNLEKVQSPIIEDVEAMVAKMDEVSHQGRVRNSWLARRSSELARDEDGRLTFHGRTCCGELVERIQSTFSGYMVGQRFDCTCGAGYVLKMRMEDGRTPARY
jgi:hypothetical protein